jgi:hypothetical protein
VTFLFETGISSIQGQFIENSQPRELFDSILAGPLDLTESEYGFIGEILRSPEGKRYLKTHALTNIAWDDETKTLFDKHHKDGLEFHNLDTLFGVAIVTEKPVIANDPRNDRGVFRLVILHLMRLLVYHYFSRMKWLV